MQLKAATPFRARRPHSSHLAARQQLQNIYNEKCQQVFIFMAQHSSVLLLVEVGQQCGRVRKDGSNGG